MQMDWPQNLILPRLVLPWLLLIAKIAGQLSGQPLNKWLCKMLSARSRFCLIIKSNFETITMHPAMEDCFFFSQLPAISLWKCSFCLQKDIENLHDTLHQRKLLRKNSFLLTSFKISSALYRLLLMFHRSPLNCPVTTRVLLIGITMSGMK